jgi:hypothetical protein
MFTDFMLALLSITVSHVMIHLVVLAQHYSNDPLSNDPRGDCLDGFGKTQDEHEHEHGVVALRTFS